MDLKDATSCGRCAGTIGCRRGKGPQSYWALIHRPASPFCWGWLDCSTASGLPRGGRCSHTVLAVFNAFLFPHPDAGECEHAGGAGSVFFRPNGRCQCVSLCLPFDEWLSCVSWILHDPLVELYHWLQGEGTGGLVTSRWLIVREPREPALSYCSHSGPRFILLMCGQRRLKRNSREKKRHQDLTQWT